MYGSKSLLKFHIFKYIFAIPDAMIKMLDDLKARVAQLEDENRNLKMALPEVSSDLFHENIVSHCIHAFSDFTV